MLYLWALGGLREPGQLCSEPWCWGKKLSAVNAGRFPPGEDGSGAMDLFGGADDISSGSDGEDKPPTPGQPMVSASWGWALALSLKGSPQVEDAGR